MMNMVQGSSVLVPLLHLVCPAAGRGVVNVWLFI